MTSEKQRSIVSCALREMMDLALEAEQVSLAAPKEAEGLAEKALRAARRASQEAGQLETDGERRVVGRLTGVILNHLTLNWDL